MRRIWNVSAPAVEKRRWLARHLGISEVTAQILVNRGIETLEAAKAFLGCRLSSMHEPSLLKDIDRAVERIGKAVAGGEKILVYGDYDVDGITGVTVVYSALRAVGAHVDHYIPNRVEEGYGLNLAAIRLARRRNVSVIITVDCGISSFAEIDYAASVGIDVIVTDHHDLSEKGLPRALCVINPLRNDCPYPFKHLAGVGVAYKLARLVLERAGLPSDEYLDLVALGTVADIVPQVDENRVLTKYGIGQLNRTERAGLKALIEVSGLGGRDISSGHIGFILGPRINAMGRIGSAEVALRLLLTKDADEARTLAATLDAENRNRQRIEAKILSEALAKVEREVNFSKHRVIVLESDAWHPGVIGIVASRIAERFYRPTILISTSGARGKGSGRSIRNFDLFGALAFCKDRLLAFGGHEGACGITIEKGEIGPFRDAINEVASRRLRDDDLLPRIDIDADVPLRVFDETLIQELESLAPFGPDNPRPVLSSCGLAVKDPPRPIGRGGFKMFVTDGKATCEAVSFGRQTMHAPQPGSTVDVAYIPSINTWQGISSVQLEIKDIR